MKRIEKRMGRSGYGAARLIRLMMAITALVMTLALPAQAAERLLYSIGLHSNDARLSGNEGAVRGPDGTVYFVSSGRFNEGSALSSIAPNGSFTTLHVFNGGRFFDVAGNTVSDLGSPRGTPIIASNGVLYGVANSGGANGRGGVFRYQLTGSDAGQYRVLYSFQPATDGGDPIGGLIEGSDGRLYGTTSAGGGTANRGTVFRLTKAGVLTVLKNFSTPATAADGQRPVAALVQGSDGAYYGSTSEGGSNASGGGTVFRVTSNGGFTVLHSFAGYAGLDGSTPVGALAQSNDGNFYGSTREGGPTAPNSLPGRGTLFRVSPAGVFTRLYTFYGDSTSADGVSGSTPYGGLVRATDGNFYGTNTFGVAGNVSCRGKVYRLTPAGVVSELFCFTADDGIDPVATLTLGADGALYGSTTGAGLIPADTTNGNPNGPASLGGGTVFRITTGGAFTRLATVDALPNEGRAISGALIQAIDGTYYGVTATDQRKRGGTVFSLTPDGVLSTLHVLTNSNLGNIDGYQPESSLIPGPDGAFYGVAETGGVNGVGSVFRVTTAGDYSTIYSFTGGSNGLRPKTALTLGSDGNFYGTTSEGGSGTGNGTIFRVSPTGSYTQLHSFNLATTGNVPLGKLLLASDGNFYGTTTSFGASSNGTVYRMTPAGVVTVLHAFTGQPSEGGGPVGGLVQGVDGAFYGTTSGGGANGSGTVFRLARNGVFSTLYNFSDATGGRRPLSPLLLARDGNFYGTAANITFNVPRGLLYRITPQGQYSIVHQLAEVGDGLDFEDEPIQASNATGGELVVPTRNGGTFGFGAVLAVSGPADRVIDLSGKGAKGGTAKLSWSTTARALTYNVYRGTTVGGEGTTPIASGITAGGLSAAYTATGLIAGSTYYFTVTAVNSVGETQFSNELKVKAK